jgi:hypothetical protein
VKVRPIRGRRRGRRRFGSGEGKVLFDVFDVGVGNKGGLAENAFAFAALALQQVAFALFATEYFPGACHFEALGDGFPCLCFSSNSWHGARNLGSVAALARQKWYSAGKNPWGARAGLASAAVSRPPKRGLDAMGLAGKERLHEDEPTTMDGAVAVG